MGESMERLVQSPTAYKPSPLLYNGIASEQRMSQQQDLATLTAVEAFFGLLIEGIFIAASTRRVTGN